MIKFNGISIKSDPTTATQSSLPRSPAHILLHAPLDGNSCNLPNDLVAHLLHRQQVGIVGDVLVAELQHIIGEEGSGQSQQSWLS